MTFRRYITALGIGGEGDRGNMRKTRNPKIWIMYTAWHIVTWMNKHKPYYPLWLRVFMLKRFDVDIQSTPLMKPWRRVERMFRKIRGNHAHRCDFTDKKNGLLYGGDGETMNKLWSEFMRRLNYEDN